MGQHVQRHLGGMCLSVFILKYVAPIDDLIVPNGCSTVLLRKGSSQDHHPAALDALEYRFVLPATNAALFPVAHLALIGQLPHAFIQYECSVLPAFPLVKR
jgi:hypothetical protein